ncbi:MAG: hypothetical protein K6G42_07145 [Lachnospiraceae bacterium]|nr:hypothetical protein [Lachnospiraceae bacterium]
MKCNRKLTETLPVGVYSFMLLAYLLGITGHIGHIVELFILYEAIGMAAVIFFAAVKKEDIRKPFSDPGNLIFLVLLLILWIVSLHMRVTNFDDFHSWAITPKDIFYVDGLPTGNRASTFYRDYFPLVYFMDFLVFKLMGRYTESAMFFVLWALMLVSLTEMFHRREEDDLRGYICRVAAGIMLPFLMSFQFLHCLGTDILATTIFGSVLTYIMTSERETDRDMTVDMRADILGKGGFDLLRIVLATTVLSMMKTTSMIFSAVCIALYFVRNIDLKRPVSWVRFSILPACTVLFWGSWKAFCRIKGNTTYLSENLNKNISSGHSGFPYYTVSTIKEYTAKLFTYGLNDGVLGLTSVMILLLFIISFMIYMSIRGRSVRDRLSLGVIILGMVGYLLVMIYVYLFVFEEWEALTLSSYDRYITSYFGAMLYLALYLLLLSGKTPGWVMPAFLAMLAITINYPYVAKTLIPSGYEKEYGETIEEIEEIEKEFMDAAGELPAYGESILVVEYTTDQLRAKVIPYAAVPGVTRLIRPSEEGEMPTESEIEEAAADYGARVIDLRGDRE